MSPAYGLLFAIPITLILEPSLHMIDYDMKYVLERLRNKRWLLASSLQTESNSSRLAHK